MSILSGTKNADGTVKFAAGTIIFVQGKAAKYLYIVKSGQVRLVNVKGQSLSVIELCGEREILNEVSVLTNKPNELTAIAKTDVELVLVDHKDVSLVMENSPSWIKDIFETLCERLKSTQEMIDEHNLATDKDPGLMISKEEEKKYLQSLADFKSL